MVKKTIKVKFASGFGSIGTILEYLEKRFNVRVLDKDFDYFICNESIYRCKEDFFELLNLKPEVIRIIFCWEALYPDLNLFDYAVCYDSFDSSRILALPVFDDRIGQLYNTVDELDLSKNGKKPEDILKEKTKFCNFIYGNSVSHPTRDALFYKLSEYKQVESLGRHLKNVEINDTRFCDDWAKISIDLKRPYKFSIAAENASFRGYTSEKIITSMMANTIPVYFGNPDIVNEFNSKSFINVNEFNNLDDVLKRVKEIDENDDLYCSIMAEPWRTPEQKERQKKANDEYLNGLYNIFEQEFNKAHRRPQGCWADYLYPGFFKSLSAQKQPERKISFAENLFSVKNDSSKQHKLIRFFGVKITINKNKKHLNP